PGLVEVAELGADLGGHQDQVALIGGYGAAAKHRGAQIVGAHVRIVREATRPEDHALVRAEALGAVGGFDFDADHAAFLIGEDAGDAVTGEDGAAIVPDIGTHRADHVRTEAFGAFRGARGYLAAQDGAVLG